MGGKPVQVSRGRSGSGSEPPIINGVHASLPPPPPHSSRKPSSDRNIACPDEFQHLSSSLATFSRWMVANIKIMSRRSTVNCQSIVRARFLRTCALVSNRSSPYRLLLLAPRRCLPRRHHLVSRQLPVFFPFLLSPAGGGCRTNGECSLATPGGEKRNFLLLPPSSSIVSDFSHAVAANEARATAIMLSLHPQHTTPWFARPAAAASDSANSASANLYPTQTSLYRERDHCDDRHQDELDLPSGEHETVKRSKKAIKGAQGRKKMSSL